MTDQPTKKLTLRDRKNAQPHALQYFSPDEKATIIKTVAKDLDEGQRGVFFYTCQALGLNPLLNEIACIVFTDRKTGEKKMSIQVMRDGFLTIAHRSGKFAGLESGVKQEEGKGLIGWAKVYHKDFKVPVYQEADFKEYSTDRNPLWASKPNTMIKKVAESMALRKAFNINGVYAPEEMEREVVLSDIPELAAEEAAKPATAGQIQTIKTLMKYDALLPEEQLLADSTLEGITYGEATEKVKELSKPVKK